MSDGSADRPLDGDLVARLIAHQFPDLAGSEVRPLGAGWDNELFTVGVEWIFRFPKRAERVPWLVREIELMAIVSETVGSMAPRFGRFGVPSPMFPYPFVAYRRLPGVGADEADACDLAVLAADIAGLLSRLHRIDPERVPGPPVEWESERWRRLGTDLAMQAAAVRPLLRPDLLGVAEPYLSGVVPAPLEDGPRRFIHNDICADHLLVDRHTGRLSGLVDFTDAKIGDPVLDFVGLVTISGRSFIDDVVAHYELWVDDAFDLKLDWLSRVLTLTWLAEAVTVAPSAFDKHLVWVDRAFDDAAED